MVIWQCLMVNNGYQILNKIMAIILAAITEKQNLHVFFIDIKMFREKEHQVLQSSVEKNEHLLPHKGYRRKRVRLTG